LSHFAASLGKIFIDAPAAAAWSGRRPVEGMGKASKFERGRKNMKSKLAPYTDLIAAMILESGAVKVSVEKPFTLTSGKLSPLYFDCRRLISHPAAMTVIAGVYQWIVQSEGLEIDAVAGGESAGIPFADRLAAILGKPMVYVRKERRAHGTGSQIEGSLAAGARAALVEDMITDGGSKIVFVKALREAGAVVEHCFLVLDREQGGAEALRAEGVKLHALATASSVLDYGARSGALPAESVKAAAEYLKAPEKWGTMRSAD
jgi:orotate phosphoribosyltransferase